MPSTKQERAAKSPESSETTKKSDRLKKLGEFGVAVLVEAADWAVRGLGFTIGVGLGVALYKVLKLVVLS